MLNSILLQAASSGGGMQTIIMMLLMFGVVYLFMIRPQMRRQKQEKAFQKNVGKGTKIVTTSGIHGKISEVNDFTISLETSAGKITVEKTSISSQLSQERYEENKSDKK